MQETVYEQLFSDNEEEGLACQPPYDHAFMSLFSDYQDTHVIPQGVTDTRNEKLDVVHGVFSKEPPRVEEKKILPRDTSKSITLIAPDKKVLYIAANPHDTLLTVVRDFDKLLQEFGHCKYFVDNQEMGTQRNENALLRKISTSKKPVQAYFYGSVEAPREIPHYFAIRLRNPTKMAVFFTVLLEKTYTAAQADLHCKTLLHDDYYWHDQDEMLHSKNEFIHSLQCMWLYNNAYVELKSFGNKTLEEIKFFHHNKFNTVKDYIKIVCPEQYCFKRKK